LCSELSHFSYLFDLCSLFGLSLFDLTVFDLSLFGFPQMSGFAEYLSCWLIECLSHFIKCYFDLVLLFHLFKQFNFGHSFNYQPTMFGSNLVRSDWLSLDQQEMFSFYHL